MRKIPDKIDSKFRYVLLASCRAEQLMRGAPPKLEMRSAKQTRIAMEEVMREVLNWDYGPEPVQDTGGNTEVEEAETLSA